MKDFEQTERIPMTDDQAKGLAERFGISLEELHRLRADEEKDYELFVNDKYQVARRIAHPEKNAPVPLPIVHLSIKRLDREPVHDWRDLQWIKNQLVGDEIEMWECYPKESHLIDTANQYHMWGFLTDKKIIPFGWTEPRRVIDHDPENEKQTNTKQRKL